MSEPQLITCDDNVRLSATLYRANSPKGVVVIGAAIGIPQGFYRAFCSFLASSGYSCITFDYRGTGSSFVEQQALKIKLEDWGVKDIEAVIKFSKRHINGDELPVHFIGHSIGGQVVGLASASLELSSITCIATSLPFWRRWPFPKNFSVLALAKLVIPSLAAFRSEFPANKVGLGSMNFPTTVAKRWAKWMSHPDYLFAAKFNLNTQYYQSIAIPLLSYGFEDDGLAPEQNINRYLARFPNAKVTRRSVAPEELGKGLIGHSGFFKEKFQDSLWRDTLSWLDSLVLG